MFKIVQAFFLFFLQKSIFLVYFLSLFLLFECKSTTYSQFRISFFSSECSQSIMLPDIYFFQKSTTRANLLEPRCKIFKQLEKQYPFIIDGMSPVSQFFFRTPCIFESGKFPISFQGYDNIFLWNVSHNQFSSFYIFYMSYLDSKRCGFFIIPKKPLKENSLYLFNIRKNFFDLYLKKQYKEKSDLYWQKIKNHVHSYPFTPYQKELIEFAIDNFKTIYPFYKKENLFIIIPVRSSNGIFPPLLYYLQKRKKLLIPKIIKKKKSRFPYLLSHHSTKNFSGDLLTITYQESQIKKLNNYFYIPYPGSKYQYHLKMINKNKIHIFIPDPLPYNSFNHNNSLYSRLNIFITNGNIIKIPLFRKLAHQTNSIYIIYPIYKNKYKNFISDIFIYQHLDSFLKEININPKIIKNIYKFCISDIECISATFYEKKISIVFTLHIPNYILQSFQYGNYNKPSLYLNQRYRLPLSTQGLLLQLKKDLIEDIFQPYLYQQYQSRLNPYLNFHFSLFNIEKIYIPSEYKKIIQIINTKKTSRYLQQ